MNPKRILVTGSNGQLGQTLQEMAPVEKGLEFVFLDRHSLSIEQHQTLFNYLSLVRFDYCINTAAYTAVDVAESERDLAYQVNATAVEKLALACRENQVKLIHLSTDYVFAGNASIPYRESDTTDPVNYYGYTKRRGEELSQALNPDIVILRTSWLYSPFGKNFVKTMLRLMTQRETLKVVDDQKGSPTYTFDLADAILFIIKSHSWKAGIYHYCNEGAISWFEFAESIRASSKSDCKLYPIPTTEFPTPAKRPHFSVLDCHKILEAFGIGQQPWKLRLEDCLRKLRELE